MIRRHDVLFGLLSDLDEADFGGNENFNRDIVQQRYVQRQSVNNSNLSKFVISSV